MALYAGKSFSHEAPGLRRAYLKWKFKFTWKLKRVTASLVEKAGLGRLLLLKTGTVSADSDRNQCSNYLLLHPPETIVFGDPAQEPFLQSCQSIKEGKQVRGNIFVCEIESAWFYPEEGVVLNRDRNVVVESILDDDRLSGAQVVFKPLRWSKRPGTFSSIQHLWPRNNWHWMVDFLPQLLSLKTAMAGKELTLLMPESLSKFNRESLDSVLPENFKVEYVPSKRWIHVDRFILPSHVSRRFNGYLPNEYYEYIRETTFKRLGVAKPEKATRRYYISRNGAAHRRVINEEQAMGVLKEFGFEWILIEKFTMKEQIEIFRNAEAIISPHGAAFGGVMFSDNLKMLVLYPERRPGVYFYTLARGMGHQHFAIHSNVAEDDDFEVDLAELRRVVSTEMKLDPVQ
jgi:Glycosyltransferase 61